MDVDEVEAVEHHLSAYPDDVAQLQALCVGAPWSITGKAVPHQRLGHERPGNAQVKLRTRCGEPRSGG